MFANLKNKLIEEVKASPSKFQQLANAAQAAVSSTTNTSPSGSDIFNSSKSREQCFSITEEDTPEHSPSVRSRAGIPKTDNGAFHSTANGIRPRRLSNSSMTSDMSFRLPQYDMPTSSNNFQSDLEMSGSEADDSVSTVKLDVISKEQMFDAYKKCIDRYNKYRSRYMNLAKKYKDLEQDSSKARAVLVETQEKAMRRINELREQCSLEHNAKMQCEKSLRMEIEEIQLKMQQQQRDQNQDEHFQSESDRDSRLRNLEQQLAARDTAIQALKSQEEENSLLLAQTKLAIHSELEAKEKDVLKLNQVVKDLQNELQSKEQSQKAQNEELQREHVRHQEIEAKLIAAEHMLEKLQKEHALKEKEMLEKDQKNASQLAESYVKIHNLEQINANFNKENLSNKNHEHLDELEVELERIKSAKSALTDMLNAKDTEITQLKMKIENFELDKQNVLFDMEKKLEQTQNDNEMAQNEIQKLRTLLVEKEEEFREKMAQIEKGNEMAQDEIQKTREVLIEKEEELREKMAEMQKENLMGQDEIQKLRSVIIEKEEEFKERSAETQKENQIDRDEIQNLRKALAKSEDKILDLQSRNNEQSRSNNGEDIEKLLKEKELAQKEVQNLRNQVESILHVIEDIEHQLEEVNKSHSQLETEKQHLEKRIESMRNDSHLLVQTQEDLKKLQENGHHDSNLLLEKQEQLNQAQEHVSQLKNDLFECQVKANEIASKWELSEQKREEEARKYMENAEKLLKSEHNIKLMEEKIFLLEIENVSKVNEYEKIEKEIKTLKDVMKSLENEKLYNSQQLENLSIQLDKKQRALDEEVDRRLSSEAKLHEIQKQLEQREKIMETLEVENIEKAAQLENLRKELEKLQKGQKLFENETRKNIEKNAQIENLKRELVELQEKLQQFENQNHLIKSLESVQKERDVEFETLKKELNEKICALSEEVDLRKSLEMKLQTNQNEVKYLEKQLQSTSDNFELKFKVLEESSTNWEIKYASLEKEKQILEEKLTSKANNSENLVSKNKSLEESVLRWEEKYANLERELKESSEQLQSSSEKEILQEEKNALEAKLLLAVNNSRKFEDQAKELENNALSWQNKFEQLEVENNELREELMENETLKKQVVQLQHASNENENEANKIDDKNDNIEKEEKFKIIMQEVQDVSARNVFLEQQCENYLILEQANERLKLQNAKLLRQLDETLVSIQHSDYVPANTEFEYLKNIMFQYLTGSTNNDTLVKVISAVLKFSPQQTQVALEKEHQKRSLLNKIL